MTDPTTMRRKKIVAESVSREAEPRGRADLRKHDQRTETSGFYPLGLCALFDPERREIMKPIRLIAVLLAALFCLSSCTSLAGEGSEITTGGGTPASPESSTTDDITTGEDQSTTETYSIYPECDDPIVLEYFDITLSHKPDMEDLFRLIDDVGLRKGLYFSEDVPITKIIEYLGKPHAFGPFSGISSFVWYSKEGLYLCIIYFVSEQAPSDIAPTQWNIETGVAHGLLICNQEDSPKPLPSYLFDKKSSTESGASDTTDTLETSIGPSETSGSSNTTAEPGFYWVYLDPYQSHKPTNADAMCITENMTFTEIFEILGGAHRHGVRNEYFHFRWDTVEGGKIEITFLLTDSRGSFANLFMNLIEHGVIDELVFEPVQQS